MLFIARVHVPYQPPLPAKPGARSKPNPVGRKRRNRDEDEEEGDINLVSLCQRRVLRTGE